MITDVSGQGYYRPGQGGHPRTGKNWKNMFPCVLKGLRKPQRVSGLFLNDSSFNFTLRKKPVFILCVYIDLVNALYCDMSQRMKSLPFVPVEDIG